MANQSGRPGGRPLEPWEAGLRDAAVHGARGVRAMSEGLRQSARHKQRGGWRRPDPPGGYRGARLTGLPPESHELETARYYVRGRRGGPPSVLGLLDNLTGSLAELIARSGDLAYEVATAIADEAGPSSAASGDGDAAELVAAGAPGEAVSIGMALWNTGDVALHDVSIAATDLLGPEKPIKSSAVKFDPPTIATLAAGAGIEVVAAVKIPANAASGTYRGLIGVEHLDAYAVLEIVVGAGVPSARAATSARWAAAGPER